MTEIDEGHLYSSFQREFLQLRYFSADAIYVVEDIHRSYPYVEIFVFDKDEEVITLLCAKFCFWMPIRLQQNVFKRVGWKRRLLPPHCDWTPSLDCFPMHLLELPLPQKRLGRHTYDVPMGGIEIQKYHYADNWWKSVETKNCNMKMD